MSNVEEKIYQKMPHSGRTALLNLHAIRIERHRYGKRYLQLLQEFERLAYASVDERESDQRTRLSRVLRHAREHSKYYSTILKGAHDSALAPNRAMETLRALPLLTKATVRNQLQDLLTAAPKSDWIHGHTSGTTGTPLEIWYDRETCYATNAADRLQKRIVGVDDNEYIGLFLGRQIVPRSVNKPPYWIANRIQRQVWYSSLHMSPITLPAYIEDIRRRGLKVLEGYPSTLYTLARHLLERGEHLPMHAVFCSSETLHPVQRVAIEQAFASPLYDYFGHAERTIFAIECKANGGKHLVEPFCFAEVVKADGQSARDGEEGYLVGTSLVNLATPMLRYLTSDISAMDHSPCDCGIGFPRMSNVSTKAEDMIVLPDGRFLSPSALTHPFKPYVFIRKSQVVQEEINRFTVRIVAGGEFGSADERELVDRLRERLGEGVLISLKRVEDIPAEASGKYRWVISRVSNPLTLKWS